MRNMSFFLTQEQFKARTKDVTRRLGWKTLKPGELVQAVVKCQGLRPGEKIQRLGIIRVKSVHREFLDEISQNDVIREGFPKLGIKGFIDMFCLHMKVKPETCVTRIHFEYVEAA